MPRYAVFVLTQLHLRTSWLCPAACANLSVRHAASPRCIRSGRQATLLASRQNLPLPLRQPDLIFFRLSRLIQVDLLLNFREALFPIYIVPAIKSLNVPYWVRIKKKKNLNIAMKAKKIERHGEILFSFFFLPQGVNQAFLSVHFLCGQTLNKSVSFRWWGIEVFIV